MGMAPRPCGAGGGWAGPSQPAPGVVGRPPQRWPARPVEAPPAWLRHSRPAGDAGGSTQQHRECAVQCCRRVQAAAGRAADAAAHLLHVPRGVGAVVDWADHSLEQLQPALAGALHLRGRGQLQRRGGAKVDARRAADAAALPLLRLVLGLVLRRGRLAAVGAAAAVAGGVSVDCALRGAPECCCLALPACARERGAQRRAGPACPRHCRCCRRRCCCCYLRIPHILRGATGPANTRCRLHAPRARRRAAAAPPAAAAAAAARRRLALHRVCGQSPGRRVEALGAQQGHQIEARLLQQRVRAPGQHDAAAARQRARQPRRLLARGDEKVVLADHEQHALLHLQRVGVGMQAAAPGVSSAACPGRPGAAAAAAAAGGRAGGVGGGGAPGPAARPLRRCPAPAAPGGAPAWPPAARCAARPARG